VKSLVAFAALTIGVLNLTAQTPTKTSGTPAQQSSSASATKHKTRESSKPRTATGKVASIKSFRVIQEEDGPAVEILSTKPLVPEIQQIDSPVRLVIDLKNAHLDVPQKRIRVNADQIITLRGDQFQANPPVARVVVDLSAPRSYSWNAEGNRLVVHISRNPLEAGDSPFQPPTVASFSSTPGPVIKAVRAAGPLAVTTNAASVGSSFTAGSDTAVLSLSSGGELRVCPGTTVSITPSQSRHNLLLGMNTGALEAHLQLDTSTDSIMTPDFRILLVGPGEFHYAFSADRQGNTCVRALPGNTAAAIVTELLGDRTYQVKAADQLVFRSGQIDRIDTSVPLECGCPPPRPLTQLAANELPSEHSTQSQSGHASNASTPSTAQTPNQESALSGVPKADPGQTTSSPSNELHVQVSAPLVFHAEGPPPAPAEDVRALPLASRETELPEVAAPPPANQPSRASGAETTTSQPHGFFHKLGRFFASMFH